jgi:hypothetical protein
VIDSHFLRSRLDYGMRKIIEIIVYCVLFQFMLVHNYNNIVLLALDESKDEKRGMRLILGGAGC